MRETVFALVASALLAACSDDNSNQVTNPTTATGTSTTATTTPSTCTQTTLTSSQVTADRNVLTSVAFTTSTAGRVDVTVDWTNADLNVGAFLVNGGTCTQQNWNAQKCSFLVQSGSDKPHKLSASLPAGNYELLINNFGGTRGTRTATTSETVSAQVVLSAGDNCPAFP